MDCRNCKGGVCNNCRKSESEEKRTVTAEEFMDMFMELPEAARVLVAQTIKDIQK